VKKIEEFQRLCEELKLKLKAPLAYEYHSPGATKSMTLAALVHGNEIGGLEILLKLLNDLKSGELKPQIHLRFILGNTWAYEAGKRFVKTDMNRSFLLDNPTTEEELRAQTIFQVAKDSDVVLDLHQTIEPTRSAFYAFNYSDRNYQFARTLSDLPVITYKAFSGLYKGVGLANAATKSGLIGITIETGEKGIFSEQTELGYRLVKKAISVLEGKLPLHPQPPFTQTYTWGESIQNPDFSLELVQRWRNFEEVLEGQLLARSSEREVYSSLSGPVLFPKYDENQKHSLELVRILKPVHQMSDLD
jgi:succinylglutamate desuccinylase